MLNGISASDGIGIGNVLIIEEHSLEYTPKTVENPDAESQRFRNAVDEFCKNTLEQADNLRKSTGDKEAEILEGHIAIIKDPYLCGEIEKQISDGQCAESALEYMCDMFISMFSAADDELTKQRATDVRDIKTGTQIKFTSSTVKLWFIFLHLPLTIFVVFLCFMVFSLAGDKYLFFCKAGL